MTPKEKAKYLVNKSMPLAHDWESDNKIVAVKIALLCVDEIQSYPNNEFIVKGSLTYNYWNEVRKEINEL